MKEYSTVILWMAFALGGLYGFCYWIQYMADALTYGNTLGFVLMFVFVELLIPFYGFLPFVCWFFVLFFVGLPFYGLYKLFTK